MAMNKKGNTVFFKNSPRVTSFAAVCGSKESTGIIGSYADITLQDDMYEESTYEKAECKMLTTAIALAIEKGGYSEGDIDVLLSGDLLNQIISASFAARDYNFPFLGVYSACSTMSESMLLGAMLVNAGYVKKAVAATGSHFASAERQYRYPLELGCTRPPQAQWTVTGAGGCVITDEKKGIKIVNGTMGKVCDFGVTDVNNMGAAMAPADAIIPPYGRTHIPVAILRQASFRLGRVRLVHSPRSSLAFLVLLASVRSLLLHSAADSQKRFNTAKYKEEDIRILSAAE